MNSAREDILAQEKFIRAQLQTVPATARLTRSSLEARLEELTKQLALAEDSNPTAKAKLTFRGAPVLGSQGIFADFGGKAMTSFTDAVAAVHASNIGRLKLSGPLPARDECRLMITGTAVGSFGFVLEEFDTPLPFGYPGVFDSAVGKVQDLIKATTETDDDLAASAFDVNPRAVEKVRDFLQTMVSYEAVCSININEKTFGFRDVNQVRNSVNRLSKDNLVEDVLTLEGSFQGVFPTARTFEFRIDDPEQVINGKIAAEVEEPGAINQKLNTASTIEVLRTRVGIGRPRYLLTKVEFRGDENPAK